MQLLDDPAKQLASVDELYDTYRIEGVEAAMGKFFADNGLDDDMPPLDQMPPDAAETFVRVSGNFEYWLAHGLKPLSLYRPDVDTLRAGQPHIVVAIGERSKGQPIGAMALALATRLGIKPTAFPGDHMAFGPEFDAFAEALTQALA